MNLNENINKRFEEQGDDRRVRKTKKALRSALIKLLGKKTIGEITVKELTDEADVHRGTFYNHYKDAVDLMEQVESEIKQELLELSDGMSDQEIKDSPFPLLMRVACYMEENRDVAKMLAEGSLSGDSFGGDMMSLLCGRIADRCMGSALFGESLRYGTKFCAAGIEGMLTAWIEDKMRMPPVEVATVLESMLRGSRISGDGKDTFSL